MLVVQANDFLYLDYVSTTPLNIEVFNMYQQLLKQHFVNCDSLYEQAAVVSKLQEKARMQIAKLLDVKKNEVIFTSGASEANNMAIKGVAWAMRNKGKHIITSKVEHSSVMASMQQLANDFEFDITCLDVNEKGSVSLDDLRKAIRSDTILVSIMWINNEIGSINPINEIAEFVKFNSKAYFHVDGVQGFGKYDLNLKNIDLFSISMHKIFGLKGSGILIKKQHVPMLSLVSAGQQEYGLRGGTSNYCVNIMAAKSVFLALSNQKDHFTKVKATHDYLISELKQLPVTINSTDDGSVYIVNFSCLTIKSEVMMNALNQNNIAVSAQSTCHSRLKEVSHVYQAMNYGLQQAESAIRIGLDYPLSISDIQRFIIELKGIIEKYG
ncbi:MAG: cysteine desulfurase family protein [Erysipelotrichaceae bacterium]|nr:cysteine desulfurase family protein [Erysipelotrichaceae bacterium]